MPAIFHTNIISCWHMEKYFSEILCFPSRFCHFSIHVNPHQLFCSKRPGLTNRTNKEEANNSLSLGITTILLLVLHFLLFTSSTSVFIIIHETCARCFHQTNSYISRIQSIWTFDPWNCFLAIKLHILEILNINSMSTINKLRNV